MPPASKKSADPELIALVNTLSLDELRASMRELRMDPNICALIDERIPHLERLFPNVQASVRGDGKITLEDVARLTKAVKEADEAKRMVAKEKEEKDAKKPEKEAP